MIGIDTIHRPLVDSGVFGVHTQQTFPENRVISLLEAAEYTRRINTPENLVQQFLKKTSLYRKEFSTGETVLTLAPTGGYSPGSLLVVAAPADLLHAPVDEYGRVQTLTIHDFPESVSVEYARQILVALNAMKKEHPKKDAKVLFTENAAHVVSNETSRVARTVALPHTQIWVAENQKADTFTKNDVSLEIRTERRIVKLLTQYIKQKLADFPQENHEVLVRWSPPYGYSITLPLSENDSVAKQAQGLSQFMNAHHQFYTEAAERVLGLVRLKEASRKKILPQPSYRVYGLYTDEGMLQISIAPTILAQSGVVEALDRQIQRSNQHPPFFESPEEENQYYASLAVRMQENV